MQTSLVFHCYSRASAFSGESLASGAGGSVVPVPATDSRVPARDFPSNQASHSKVVSNGWPLERLLSDLRHSRPPLHTTGHRRKHDAITHPLVEDFKQLVKIPTSLASAELREQPPPAKSSPGKRRVCARMTFTSQCQVRTAKIVPCYLHAQYHR